MSVAIKERPKAKMSLPIVGGNILGVGSPEVRFATPPVLGKEKISPIPLNVMGGPEAPKKRSVVDLKPNSPLLERESQNNQQRRPGCEGGCGGCPMRAQCPIVQVRETFGGKDSALKQALDLGSKPKSLGLEVRASAFTSNEQVTEKPKNMRVSLPMAPAEPAKKVAEAMPVAPPVKTVEIPPVKQAKVESPGLRVPESASVSSGQPGVPREVGVPKNLTFAEEMDRRRARRATELATTPAPEKQPPLPVDLKAAESPQKSPAKIIKVTDEIIPARVVSEPGPAKPAHRDTADKKPVSLVGTDTAVVARESKATNEPNPLPVNTSKVVDMTEYVSRRNEIKTEPVKDSEGKGAVDSNKSPGQSKGDLLNTNNATYSEDKKIINFMTEKEKRHNALPVAGPSSSPIPVVESLHSLVDIATSPKQDRDPVKPEDSKVILLKTENPDTSVNKAVITSTPGIQVEAFSPASEKEKPVLEPQKVFGETKQQRIEIAVVGPVEVAVDKDRIVKLLQYSEQFAVVTDPIPDRRKPESKKPVINHQKILTASTGRISFKVSRQATFIDRSVELSALPKQQEPLKSKRQLLSSDLLKDLKLTIKKPSRKHGEQFRAALDLPVVEASHAQESAKSKKLSLNKDLLKDLKLIIKRAAQKQVIDDVVKSENPRFKKIDFQPSAISKTINVLKTLIKEPVSIKPEQPVFLQSSGPLGSEGRLSSAQLPRVIENQKKEGLVLKPKKQSGLQKDIQKKIVAEVDVQAEVPKQAAKKEASMVDISSLGVVKEAGRQTETSVKAVVEDKTFNLLVTAINNIDSGDVPKLAKNEEMVFIQNNRGESIQITKTELKQVLNYFEETLIGQIEPEDINADLSKNSLKKIFVHLNNNNRHANCNCNFCDQNQKTFDLMMKLQTADLLTRLLRKMEMDRADLAA